MSHVHNFSAGPCILPQEVLEQASQAVKSWDDHGLSLVEMSHRSKAFVAAMEECRALTKELLGLPDRFDVLYLQGGASLAFLTSAMNFLPEGGQAAYADTGTWSAKAIKEARHAGHVNVVTSSKEDSHNHIPDVGEVDEDNAYLHITTNNTIFGTQYAQMPKSNVPLVADIFRPDGRSSRLSIHGGVRDGACGAVMRGGPRASATGRHPLTWTDMQLGKDAQHGVLVHPALAQPRGVNIQARKAAITVTPRKAAAPT